MATYRLEMRDDGGSTETREIEADSAAAAVAQIAEETEDWVRDGEWGADGAVVIVRWELYEGDVEVADGSDNVEIEPDHDSLIRAAGGDPGCAHEWSDEGEGGCDENPGVFGLGGTAIAINMHCTRCGIHRSERKTGVQRNPGEHDTVEYGLAATD